MSHNTNILYFLPFRTFHLSQGNASTRIVALLVKTLENQRQRETRTTNIYIFSYAKLFQFNYGKCNNNPNTTSVFWVKNSHIKKTISQRKTLLTILIEIPNPIIIFIQLRVSRILHFQS